MSWSHYFEILKADSELEIGFYIKECEKENWSVRELKRQMKSMLFHRIALSKDKETVLEMSKKGEIIEKPEDLIKDPYVLEFLNISERDTYKEGELEDRIYESLKDFILELGRGFAYVDRQYVMQIGSRRFKVDLVFYNYILKCFFLIDLKRGEIEHKDVGQMNMYLNYVKKEITPEGDNPPVGLILGAYKDELLMEYALEGMDGKTIGGYISALFYLLSLILKVSPEEVTDELLYASQGMNNKDFDALMLIMANLCDIPKPQVFLDDRSNYCLYQKNVFLNDEIYELQDLDMILREMTGYCLVVKKFMFRDDEIIYEDPYQIVVSEEAYKRHNRNKKCDDLVMMFADSEPDESREEVDGFLDKFFKEMENKEKKGTKAETEQKKPKTEKIELRFKEMYNLEMVNTEY